MNGAICFTNTQTFFPINCIICAPDRNKLYFNAETSKYDFICLFAVNKKSLVKIVDLLLTHYTLAEIKNK